MGSEELAILADISRTALYQIESGRTGRPRATTLLKLARALGVAPESLLGRDLTEAGNSRDATPLTPESEPRQAPPTDQEIDRQFRQLLTTVWREPLIHLVECAYRLLLEAREMQVHDQA